MPLFEQLALNAVKALLIRASTDNRSSNLTDAWKEGPRLDSLSAHVDTSLISGAHIPPTFSRWVTSPTTVTNDDLRYARILLQSQNSLVFIWSKVDLRTSPAPSRQRTKPLAIARAYTPDSAAPTLARGSGLCTTILLVRYAHQLPDPSGLPLPPLHTRPRPTSHTASADLAHAGQNLRPPPRNSHLLLRPLCHSADAVCRTPSATTSPLPPPISEPVVRSSAGCPASACTLSTPSPRPRDAFVCPCVAPPSLADVTLLQLTLTVDDDSAAAARALPAPARVIIASPPSLATSHRLAHAALLRYT
ncbi:hypothetical protein B0H14DRAFT_3477616 [Mycena olivaceomarginata]|nr:hypothetical protein B0H14DRAFT_3477616 [Mycena olivaceomarginata]